MHPNSLERSLDTLSQLQNGQLRHTVMHISMYGCNCEKKDFATSRHTCGKTSEKHQKVCLPRAWGFGVAAPDRIHALECTVTGRIDK